MQLVQKTLLWLHQQISFSVSFSIRLSTNPFPFIPQTSLRTKTSDERKLKCKSCVLSTFKRWREREKTETREKEYVRKRFLPGGPHPFSWSRRRISQAAFDEIECFWQFWIKTRPVHNVVHLWDRISFYDDGKGNGAYSVQLIKVSC